MILCLLFSHLDVTSSCHHGTFTFTMFHLKFSTLIIMNVSHSEHDFTLETLGLLDRAEPMFCYNKIVRSNDG